MRSCQVAHKSSSLLLLPSHSQNPETKVNNLQALSLNQAQQVQDLTSASSGSFLGILYADHTADCVGFLGASGFASASIVYGLGDPAFIHDGYTVGTFQVSCVLNVPQEFCLIVPEASSTIGDQRDVIIQHDRHSHKSWVSQPGSGAVVTENYVRLIS